MVVCHLIRKQTYFDSVTLMLIGSQVKKLDGIENAVVGMCTGYNIDSLKRLNMYQPEFDGLTPNDLIICIMGKDKATAESGIAEVEKRLKSRKQASGVSADAARNSGRIRPPPARSQRRADFGAGEYAAREAMQALNNGRHVMLFSDNVSIEEELELKTLGVSKELLVMALTACRHHQRHSSPSPTRCAAAISAWWQLQAPVCRKSPAQFIVLAAVFRRQSALVAATSEKSAAA